MLSRPDRLNRRTGEAFEIYRPMVVASKCLECHDDFKEGKIGGVALLRISTETLAKSRANWGMEVARINNTGITVAMATTLGIAIIFIIVTMLAVKGLITKPLSRVIVRLKSSAEQLTGSSTEIADSSHSVAEGASEQAASLEETSASLEEISSMIKRSTESGRKVNELASGTRTAADKSAEDMNRMKAAMGAIAAAGGEIADIVRTIDEIAFQTNILALNAAVEAARAGQAGLVFPSWRTR